MESSNSNQLNYRTFLIETSTDVSKFLDKSENEEVYNQYSDVTLVLNNVENGSGNFYLTNLKLIWLNSDLSGHSYSFPYKSIMFHAISKDTNLFKNPCIFIQLNVTEEEEDNHSLLLSPKDLTLVEPIFENISKLSSFNETYSSDEDDANCEIYEE
ncbi:Regulator of volume decrease after cellular swelling family protein [Theileria parva strain Muguga]|uniref:Regulator of volume decrease after cellular swelling family protein n=1 Tax=Theileria parva strain Muguga TaxID=333668 RepID=UPI001C61E953|nr:Regulator of volume decrease after cellular swelling family protein [Theileria parva strain Muguga]KAF5153623.1 Regulator of volume decrease after cellular swelling family protein [Theileria parva strain Muguga]